MRDEAPKTHVLDVHDHEWTHAPGHPAGVFWLDGRSVMAAHESRAERRLLAQGAILVATLLFERDPLEGVHPGRPVERLSTRAVHDAIAPPSGN